MVMVMMMMVLVGFGDWRLEIGGRAADRVAVVGTRGSMIDQHVEDIKILWARKRKIWKDT